MDYSAFSTLCTENNTTPTALALKLGLSKGNTSSWKKGGNPSAEILMKIADELNCTTDILLGRKEQSPSIELTDDEQKLLSFFKPLSHDTKQQLIGRAELLAEQAEQEQSVNNKSIQLKHDITVSHTAETTVKCKHGFYKVSAGTGFDLDDNNFWEVIDIPATPEAKKADFCLTITGDSMEPVYYDGDIVLVKSQPSVNLGQIGIFVIEGSGYIKKFGGDRLISLNEEYDDIMFADYDSEDIRCSGLVIGRV